MRTQRFELLDPTDVQRVIQPVDVTEGRSAPRDIYRVRSGVGAGRVAAGIPLLLENATVCAEAAPRRARYSDEERRKRRSSPRSWLTLFVVGTLLLASCLLWMLAMDTSTAMHVAPPPPSQQLA